MQALQVPRSLSAGERFEVRYSLRNNTPESLRVCSAGGVSMMLRSDSGAKWPMMLHGITTDSACSGPITLQPGEARSSLSPKRKNEVSSCGLTRLFSPGDDPLVAEIELALGD
jgi:hypothetical protein